MGGGLRDPDTFAVIGAAMEVHRVLGPGFLEGVYQEALAVELGLRGVAYRREVQLPVMYKSRLLARHYTVDFICCSEVLVELKALSTIGGSDEAQLLNYLKASGASRAMLLNFGTRHLQYRRFVGGGIVHR